MEVRQVRREGRTEVGRKGERLRSREGKKEEEGNKTKGQIRREGRTDVGRKERR